MFKEEALRARGKKEDITPVVEAGFGWLGL